MGVNLIDPRTQPQFAGCGLFCLFVRITVSTSDMTALMGSGADISVDITGNDYETLIISRVMAVVLPLMVSPVTEICRDWSTRMMLCGASWMSTLATEDRGTVPPRAEGMAMDFSASRPAGRGRCFHVRGQGGGAGHRHHEPGGRLPVRPNRRHGGRRRPVVLLQKAGVDQRLAGVVNQLSVAVDQVQIAALSQGHVPADLLDDLVSLAVFDGRGELVAAVPLSAVKRDR